MEKNKRKIPGMLYIIVSFIPWIVYWILSETGNVGIIVPLAISLLLIIPQIRKWDFNLMDLASMLYFSIATVGTFIFNLKVFLESSGFLGYLVLFCMALFSLVIKQPFTFQVSKRDYPEIYWKERSFFTINNIITIVWLIVFLLNAIMFLLGKPSTVILSNILTAFGMAFSVIFPLKVPAYFASKEFKKYDWSVKVNPQKPKGEYEYDVIVVGSGIGGLTCAALLSKRGYRVLVLEQHSQVGGYCSSFKRNGFVFNTGVENVNGLREKCSINFLLKQLGLKKEDLFVINTLKFIFKGKGIEVRNLDEFKEILSNKFPDERKNIFTFFEDAQKAYDESYKDTEIYGAPLPPELIVKVFGERKLLAYPGEHPQFYDWLNKTYEQKLNEYFKDEDLKALLSGLLGHLGTKPEKTLASDALNACVSYYLYGGYFPKGGAHMFADSFKNVIKSYGGEVLVKHKVDKILIDDKKVKGVQVGDKAFRSSIVVSNTNAKTTFTEHVGLDNLDRDFGQYIKGLKMSPSCFIIFLGVDMDLSKYPTIINNMDEHFDIVINSNADSNLAPKDKASITILTIADYRDFPERGTEEYSKMKREMAEMLIKKAEKVIPDLRKHIIVQDAATPKTFERYTSMPEGALYAFDQSIGVKRPYYKTPIKGLYLASASTFPGGGIEAVVISGIICANDICNWKFKAL